MEKVTIIGAGIGGLTTAIALEQKGIEYEIFESFSAFKDLGAGIMLANNAMQVFEKLGLREKIAARGREFKKVNLRTDKMKLLSSTDTTKYAPNDLSSIAIHRSELQGILLAEIPDEKLNLGKKITNVLEVDGSMRLQFADKTEHETKCLVGADGIHSMVRKFVIGKSQIRDAKQNCWRGVCEFKLPNNYNYDLNELWGKGKRVGFVQISANKVYWYALNNNKNKEVSLSDLENEFTDFDPLVKEILTATSNQVILKNKMIDLKPVSKWNHNNICLTGDAAHATTPNLGQGACQSIEDALTLANALSESNTVEMAFERFQELRIAKAQKVVNLSWRIGKIAHFSNPLAISIRNFVLKNTPTSVMKKQNLFLNKLVE